VTQLPPSPTILMRQAAALQQQGKPTEAADLLRSGIDQLQFARCELTTNLAAILYSSGDKEGAVRELESIQPLVSQSSSPDCVRSQYLLGTIFKELDDPAKASAAFQAFMSNTTATRDQQLLDFRKNVLRSGM